MMTENQIEIIKNTWAKIAIDSKKWVDVFYPKLFEQQPELESLFTEDHNKQGQKLFMVISLMVTKINKFDTLETELQNLAQRHVNRNIKTEYFEIFKKVFLESISDCLKLNNNNQETKNTIEAWTVLYDAVSGAMIKDMKKLEKK